ncbi:MAG: S1 RNA-binding domain-containing protein [Clostridia bacterium]|nr:S1 RNA-binding domain-containing protein [Clostridia bacterium]
MMSYLPEGYLINSKENKFYLSSMENFNRAFFEQIPIEQRAAFCDCNHNLHIDFGFIHGIIPKDDCAIGIKDGTTKDIAIISRVNKPVRFIIKEINETGSKKLAILSRLEVQNKFLNDYIPTLSTGDIIDARVTHLESFGVFCDIGCGINALLPIDNISVSRIPHPSARFTVGDDIKVIIKAFDDNGRVILSHKELLGTWEENASYFNVGETVSGIIRSIESYGIFVELTPNLSGLAEYTDEVTNGQQASVFIKSIIPEKMKFKLIIVDAFNAEYPRRKPHYFIKEGHIDTFRYSPECCYKNITTTF